MTGSRETREEELCAPWLSCVLVPHRQNDAPRVRPKERERDEGNDDLKKGDREDEATGRSGAKVAGRNGRCDQEESEEEPRVVEFTREHTREHKKDERTTVTTTSPRVEREDGRKTTATHRAELADDSTGTSVGTKEEI